MTIEKARRWIERARDCVKQLNVPDAIKALNAALYELPEPARDNRERTHWDDCWRYTSHHPCCVARCERLERERDDLRSEAATDAMVAADAQEELAECKRKLAAARRWAKLWKAKAKEKREWADELLDLLEWGGAYHLRTLYKNREDEEADDD